MRRLIPLILLSVFFISCSKNSNVFGTAFSAWQNDSADVSAEEAHGPKNIPASAAEDPVKVSCSPSAFVQTPMPTPTHNDGRTRIAEGFYYKPLDDEIKKIITGSSYPSESQDDITYEDLNYVKVLHYNFEGEVCEGELIVAADLADEITHIFYQLYLAEYPLTSIRLIDKFGGSTGDRASMSANNTSAFNYRVVAGTHTLSNHAFGRAIDINPMMNPYVKGDYVSPKNGSAYADRSHIILGMIDKHDLCYQLFTENGWFWGGDWSSIKDYQHFEKID